MYITYGNWDQKCSQGTSRDTMGHRWSQAISTAMRVAGGRGVKRTCDDLDAEDGSDADPLWEKMMHTPKRKKLLTTRQYIYQALFQEGRDSDVTLIALGKQWKLHKVYLCQSPYFASMFSGAWKEANEHTIQIEILDPNINLDALSIVLGSLYMDELTVEPADVVSILAAATLFQLDGIIEQCVSIMHETISGQTVVLYYNAANEYGALDIKDACLAWLLVNLLGYMPAYPRRLRDISVDLMSKLVSSPKLFMMQTEFSLYVLLKLWVFLREHSAWDGSPQEGVVEAHRFFKSRPEEDPFYLDMDEGKVYEPIFRGLRLQHLINHHMDVDMLRTDRIIPPSWLFPHFQNVWYHMLRIDQGVDKGPKQMSESEFNQVCLRCGRTLATDGQHMWRWTGYNFGLDLIMTYERGGLKLKRNHRADHEVLLSQQARRHVMYRITVAALDNQKQVKFQQTSGMQAVTLSKNEEFQVMQLEGEEVTFPLLLSVNLAVATPVTMQPSKGTGDTCSVENSVDS